MQVMPPCHLESQMSDVSDTLHQGFDLMFCIHYDKIGSLCLCRRRLCYSSQGVHGHLSSIQLCRHTLAAKGKTVEGTVKAVRLRTDDKVASDH